MMNPVCGDTVGSNPTVGCFGCAHVGENRTPGASTPLPEIGLPFQTVWPMGVGRQTTLLYF